MILGNLFQYELICSAFKIKFQIKPKHIYSLNKLDIFVIGWYLKLSDMLSYVFTHKYYYYV